MRNTRKKPLLHLPLIAAALFVAAAVAPVLAQAEDTAGERPPGDGPTRVEVAFYLIDLMRVIDRDETFEADVFVVARWQDARWSGEGVRIVPADQVWLPKVLIFNERDVSSRLPKVVEITPGGTMTFRQRLIGTFASSLDLRPFPMDSQTLEIRLVVYDGTAADEVLLVESTRVESARSAELAITDWEIGELEVEADTYTPVPGLQLSSLTARVEARRLIGYFLVQLLVPLILIVAMSWIPFWIDPGVIPVRTSVCVTTVLTLIAYRFMIGGLVPKLPYLTRVDYLLLGATVLVAASLATTVAGAFLVRQDRAAAVSRIDARARLVLPVAFLLLLGSLMFFGGPS